MRRIVLPRRGVSDVAGVSEKKSAKFFRLADQDGGDAVATAELIGIIDRFVELEFHADAEADETDEADDHDDAV